MARRTDYLELYRVTDYMVKESVVERALGICSFYVVSTDATSPVMHIYGIPNLRELQIELRTRVERQRQLKRIYEIGNHN
ncbi:PH domain-containing protein [Parabacteroides merdae]|uniref:PH domain-containing protein n=1 Tax=Parabacteroides TaxID=375288 RepID=UPI001D07C0E8|nr:PH domain-containing protein [Parabacteroides merdae]MCB6307170.1 PH domain-containing protein [Parabacteroides merdae]MCQ5223472.1 PH domain-containing protein [Parabacteroides merdae]